MYIIGLKHKSGRSKAASCKRFHFHQFRQFHGKRTINGISYDEDNHKAKRHEGEHELSARK